MEMVIILQTRPTSLCHYRPILALKILVVEPKFLNWQHIGKLCFSICVYGSIAIKTTWLMSVAFVMETHSKFRGIWKILFIFTNVIVLRIKNKIISLNTSAISAFVTESPCVFCEIQHLSNTKQKLNSTCFIKTKILFVIQYNSWKYVHIIKTWYFALNTSLLWVSCAVQLSAAQHVLNKQILILIMTIQATEM
jgi:hypothetical protein